MVAERSTLLRTLKSALEAYELSIETVARISQLAPLHSSAPRYISELMAMHQPRKS